MSNQMHSKSYERWGGNISVGSFLVLVLLCMIVSIATIFVLGAYFNFCDSNAKIVNRLDDISVQSEKIKDPNELRILKGFVERTRYIISGLTQSNTITFLFTVFSIALISGSAYVLERSRKNVDNIQNDLKEVWDEVGKMSKVTKEIAGEAGMYLTSMSAPLRIGLCLGKGQQISRELRRLDDKRKVLALVVDERDLLNSVLYELQKLEGGEYEITRTESEAFLSEVRDIKMDIEGIPTKFENLCKDLIEVCDNIISILSRIQ